jgi:hypothetical protein|tara:strand:+ start:232 stop:531 length:300 start_codon:yes stop_codon:yes gene_type:complete
MVDQQADYNMTEQTIKFRDPVVKTVVNEFVKRSNVGFEKYGQTLHSERVSKVKNLADYLLDVQEELMDAILYIQTARDELRDITELEQFDEENYNGTQI